MEPKHSHIIDPVEYETQGLCDGCPLRKNNNPQSEEVGVTRCQRDWNRFVEPLGLYKGGLGGKWNMTALVVPECLPERLEIISYAFEFAFLYDDVTEEYSREQINASNDFLQLGFLEGARNGSIQGKEKGQKYMQAQILEGMMAIDKERAATTMKGWVEFLRGSGGRQNDKHFATMREYIPYRSDDAGKWLVGGLITFGTAITVPDHEMEIWDNLTKPAWITLALQNDIFSWPKERDTARNNGRKNVVNAVWVLMEEHCIDEDQALQKLRSITKVYVSEYVAIANKEMENEELSLDLRRYLQALLFTSAGNVVWSSTCPRYNAGESLNFSQLA